MAIVNTAVILLAVPLGQPSFAVKGDWPSYSDLFFDDIGGITAFWAKQSDNAVVIQGDVFDWRVVDDPHPPIDFNRRDGVINTAIASLESGGVDFGPYDVVVCVVAVPKPQADAINDGSTGVQSRNRGHWGILIRAGNRFDMIAHEFGHAIGLDHSYGNPKYKNAPWSQYGEYGHPWCVMSAQGYGGLGGPFIPPVPKHGMTEFTGLGPSLNAASALGRGWLDPAYYDPAHDGVVEFDVRARGVFGKDPSRRPQAVQVHGDGGKTFTIEYREALGWDRGQPRPLIIVNSGLGSTADLAHPNTSSATFLGTIALPIGFGSPASVYSGNGFGVEVLDVTPDGSHAQIRLSPGHVGFTEADFSVQHNVVSERILGVGMTTWAPGEKLCVEGTWPFTKVASSQEVVINATYPLARSPVVTWTVDGQALADPSDGSITLSKKVRVANAKLADETAVKEVTVRFHEEVLPTGSRLHLFNRPEDESFTLDVTSTISTRVGSATETNRFWFWGMAYVYPAEFYDEMQACLANLGRVNYDYRRFKVLFPPDLWKRVPEGRIDEVTTLLDVLGAMRSQGDERRFEQARTELEQLVGSSVALETVATDDLLHPPSDVEPRRESEP